MTKVDIIKAINQLFVTGLQPIKVFVYGQKYIPPTTSPFVAIRFDGPNDLYSHGLHEQTINLNLLICVPDSLNIYETQAIADKIVALIRQGFECFQVDGEIQVLNFGKITPDLPVFQSTVSATMKGTDTW